MTLAQARAKAYEASNLRAGGLDPKEVRRQREEKDRVAALNTFELLARAWVASARKDRQWSSGYAGKVIRHLEIHVSPWVGLYRIKGRGNLKTAQRVREAAMQHVPARDGCRRSPPTRADANRRTSVRRGREEGARGQPASTPMGCLAAHASHQGAVPAATLRGAPLGEQSAKRAIPSRRLREET